jgi:CDP-paratose 2-epimerase
MTGAPLKTGVNGSAAPRCLSPAVLRRRSMVLITGGSGFLGANLADRLAAGGERVLIYDNLCRANVMANLEWLQRRHGHRIETAIADVRDADVLRDAMRHASAVFHLAAQVAVTCSLDDPVADFEVNARGTLNVLEAARRRAVPPPLIFASTNKVYGEPFDASRLRATEQRYLPAHGMPQAVDESWPLGLSSPYGCSKGAADAYVLDYARVFGLRAIVFRMSCLYGPRQFGTEDQGWVAHFLIRALRGQPITIFGDGRQVRDLLYVDDAVDAYLRARRRIDALAGQAFNLGGGPRNAASLLELLARFSGLGIAPPPVRFAAWRPGDQRYYVSDTSKLERLAGWRARISMADGLRHLHRWLATSGVGHGEPSAAIEPEPRPGIRRALRHTIGPAPQKVPA